MSGIVLESYPILHTHVKTLSKANSTMAYAIIITWLGIRWRVERKYWRSVASIPCCAMRREYLESEKRKRETK